MVLVLLFTSGCERRDVGRGLSDPGPVVARVNGKPLYKRDFDGYLPSGHPQAMTTEERRAYLDSPFALSGRGIANI